MKCFLCKGEMKSGFATHTVDIVKGIVIIKNVPAMICGQCGEVWFDGAVVRQIEKITSAIENAVMTEVAIISYDDLAA